MEAPPLSFTRTTTGEPHARRRRALLRQHPEVRQLFGHDPRTAWVTAGVTVVQLGLAATLQWGHDAGAWWGHPVALILSAWGLGAIFAHWLGQATHEASHDLVLRGSLANRWFAIAANGAMGFPAAMTFRRYHLGHHTYLGVDGEDTDLPHPAELVWPGHRTGAKLLWLLGYFFVYVVRGVSFMEPPNRWEWINLGVQGVINLLIWQLLGGWALAWLLMSTVFGHSLHPVAAHFVHEHYVFADGQETYSYYGPLNHLTFNVGYHVEHHDLPTIAGWRLPELRRMAPEFYDGQVSHTSWTGVLWTFITSPRMGTAQRIVRSRADFDAARRGGRAS